MDNQNIGVYNDEEFAPAFISKIESVCTSIAAAGYDPYSQINGYLLTGDDCYITRSGNARSIIPELDKSKLLIYINLYLKT